MELLSVLSIFLSGVVFGWLLHARSMFNRITQDPDKMIDLLSKYKEAKQELDQEESPLKTTEVRVEKIGDMFYLYTTKDNEFLAQGPTLEDALEAVKKRFPNRNFAGLIPKEQAEKMGLSKQS